MRYPILILTDERACSGGWAHRSTRAPPYPAIRQRRSYSAVSTNGVDRDHLYAGADAESRAVPACAPTGQAGSWYRLLVFARHRERLAYGYAMPFSTLPNKWFGGFGLGQ